VDGDPAERSHDCSERQDEPYGDDPEVVENQEGQQSRNTRRDARDDAADPFAD
jgi:hypothetical protein